MSATQKQVQVAAQLYDMRDKAKRLLGHRYGSHMTELGRILTMTAQREKKSVLEVATEVSKKRNLIGMDLLLVVAAAVELIESSDEEPTP